MINPGELARTITQNQRAITNATGSAAELGAVLGKDAVPLVVQATQAKQQYQVGLDALMKQIEDTNATVVDASEKARKGRYIPEAAQMIMSIFGMNDFDPKYQQMRVEEGLRTLDLANRRVNAVGAIAQTKEQMAEQAIKGQKLVLDAKTTEAATLEASTRTLINLQNYEDSQKLVSLSKLTDAQIAAALSNPGNAAKLAPGVEKGLIERSAQERQATNTSRATARLSLSHAEKTYPILEAITRNNLKLSDLNVQLEKAKVPNEERKIFNDSVKSIIDNMSTPARNKMLADAKANGGYAPLDLGGGRSVQISDTMIQSSISTYSAKTLDDAEKTSKLNNARAEVYAFKQSSVEINARMTAAMASVIAPDELQAMASKSATVFAFGADSDNPSAMLSAAAVAKEVEVKRKKMEDDYYKENPAQKKGVQEFIYRGLITDDNAASHLIADKYTVKINHIPAGSIFHPAGAALSGFAEYYAGKNSVFPAGMGKDEKDDKTDLISRMEKKIPEKQQAMETFLNQTSIPGSAGVNNGKSMTTGQYITGTLSTEIRFAGLQAAVLDLAVQKPDGGSVPEFSRAVVNGKLDPRYKGNTQQFFADLATSDVRMGTKSLEALAGKLNDPNFQEKIINWYTGYLDSPEAAAISKRFLNNDPISIVNSIQIDLAIALQRATQMKVQSDSDAAQMQDPSPFGTGVPPPTGSSSGYNPIISPNVNKPMINLDPIIQMLTPSGKSSAPAGNQWQGSPDMWRQRQ